MLSDIETKITCTTHNCKYFFPDISMLAWAYAKSDIDINTYYTLFMWMIMKMSNYQLLKCNLYLLYHIKIYA